MGYRETAAPTRLELSPKTRVRDDLKRKEPRLDVEALCLACHDNGYAWHQVNTKPKPEFPNK